MSNQTPQQSQYVYTALPSYPTANPEQTWSNNSEPQDQTHNLPTTTSLTNLLETPPPPLQEGNAFEAWYDTIVQTLQTHKLENLISATIPKPQKQNQPQNKRWQTLSNKVKAWLWCSLTNAQITSLSATTPTIYTLYADDLMAAIRSYVIGAGHFPLSRAMTDFMEIKRVQFPSTEAFINELRRRFRRYSDLGGLPTPYSALAIMLRELGHIPKLDLFILGKEEEVSRILNPAEVVTVWDFYGCCEEIIRFVKGTDADLPVPAGLGSGSVSAATPVSQFQSCNWNRVGGEVVSEKWPPRGMSNEDYARRWRENWPQFVDHDCVYCGRWGHGAAKCWYLNPESRPERWKSEGQLWVFEPRK